MPDNNNEINQSQGTNPFDTTSEEKHDTTLMKEEFANAVASLEGKGELDQTIPRWAQKINIWRKRCMSEFLFMIWCAFFVGLFAGFGAHIFNRLISIVTEIFTSHIKAGAINWWLIPLPIVGIVLSGIYTRYIVHTNLTHSVAQLMHQLYQGRFKLKSNIIYSPIIGGTITLGLGGSAGSEGPIAYSGAAIGSYLGRLLGLTPTQVKVLIGCGAGAGISGIFMSPMGGLLFTLEFLRMEIGTLSILAVTVACFVAYGIVFLCNGCIPHATYTPLDVIEPSQYWGVLALGVFCGLYSIYYSKTINKTDAIFRKINNPWIRNVMGGLIVGICLFLFPSLYGVGYPVLSNTIHDNFHSLMEGNILNGIHMGDWAMIIVAACILAIKCWACGSCNASGGVSSDFAPTMFAGGVAGFLFSTLCNHVFLTHLPVGVFTLLGMSAVMAGCVEAPLMTLFIVMNMGMTFDFALPIGISVYASYIVVRVFYNLRGYDNKMVRHLNWFHHNHSSGSDNSSTTSTTQSSIVEQSSK